MSVNIIIRPPMFITRSPMTLDEALRELGALGCRIVPSDDSEATVVRDLFGNHLSLYETQLPETCENHKAASVRHLKNEIRICLYEICGGATYVEAAYDNQGHNDPKWMAELLGMAIEGEDDYSAIMDALYPDADTPDPDNDD